MSVIPSRLTPAEDRVPPEHLSADDQATAREAQFLAHALLAQQLKAQGGLAVQRGVCCYCHQQCQLPAVYCDAECQADHEAELRKLARQGRAR